MAFTKLFGGREKKDASPEIDKKTLNTLLKRVKNKTTQTKYIVPASVRSQRPQVPISQVELSKEQNLLNELFANPDNAVLMGGTGKNLPKIDGVLISGGGLIKTNDNGSTGNMFGMRKRGFIE